MPLSSTIYQLDFDLPAVSSIGKTGCQIEQLFLIRRTPSIESHKGGPIELEDNVRLHHREPRGRILVMIEVWCACEEAGWTLSGHWRKVCCERLYLCIDSSCSFRPLHFRPSCPSADDGYAHQTGVIAAVGYTEPLSSGL